MQKAVTACISAKTMTKLIAALSQLICSRSLTTGVFIHLFLSVAEITVTQGTIPPINNLLMS